MRLPHASKVNRCSAIDRRPVVKKQRNLVNYLTSISLFNARKFVVCIFEISDEDLNKDLEIINTVPVIAPQRLDLQVFVSFMLPTRLSKKVDKF